MKSTLKLITIAAAVLLIACISVSAAAADEITNVTNSTNNTYVPEEMIPRYINTAEYAAEYDYWYNHYQSELPSVEEQRQQITSYLTDNSLTNETIFDNILSYIGRSNFLITYLDDSTHTVNETTGEIKYDLGAGNWLANLFGVGIKEENLPQNIAQGNALYDIYKSRYVLYCETEWDLIHGNE